MLESNVLGENSFDFIHKMLIGNDLSQIRKMNMAGLTLKIAYSSASTLAAILKTRSAKTFSSSRLPLRAHFHRERDICVRGREFTVSRLSGIFRRLLIRHTQHFWRVLRIGSHIRSASWNIQHILWLISPCKRHDAGEILISSQGSWTSVYYFLDSQMFNEVLDIFPLLSYRLTFIMLNVGIT